MSILHANVGNAQLVPEMDTGDEWIIECTGSRRNG